jgi:hypothetical protein
MLSFNPQKFKEEIELVGHDNTIKELFGNDVLITYGEMHRDLTPRERVLIKKFSAVPLWYLKFLIDAKATHITDIGCGKNFFKPLLKNLYNINVTGVDPVINDTVDEVGFFDSNFSKAHRHAYRHAFSINALHFVSLKDFAKTVKEFYDIIEPGGVGFLAMNSMRMIERTSNRWLAEQFQIDNWVNKPLNDLKPDPAAIENYIRDQLNTLDINFVVTDLLVTTCLDEYLDGNIRLVFTK